MEPNDLVLWIESRLALVIGDTLVERGRGLERPVTWLPEFAYRNQNVVALKVASFSSRLPMMLSDWTPANATAF